MISVIAAVRERTSMLHAMLTSLKDTASGEVDVVLRCDYDDDQMVSYLRMRGWNQSVIMGPRLGGYSSCAVFLNQAARLSRGDIILVVNDDAVFETPCWDRILEEEAAKFEDGMYLLGVRTLNEGNFPFTCVSRKFVNKMGFLVDERLIYTDIWVRDVMARHGRAKLVSEISIRHDWKGMSVDQTLAQRFTTSPEYARLYARCVNEGAEKVQRAIGYGTSLIRTPTPGQLRSMI